MTGSKAADIHAKDDHMSEKVEAIAECIQLASVDNNISEMVANLHSGNEKKPPDPCVTFLVNPSDAPRLKPHTDRTILTALRKSIDKGVKAVVLKGRRITAYVHTPSQKQQIEQKFPRSCTTTWAPPPC